MRIAAIYPNDLLYDVDNRYADVHFSVMELQDCLAAYLALIPVIKNALADGAGEYVNPAELYSYGHDNASELILAYIKRTPADADYRPLQQFITEQKVIAQLDAFITFLDPREVWETLEPLKRIQTVQATLAALIQT